MENTGIQNQKQQKELPYRAIHVMMCIAGIGFLFTKDFTMSVIFLGLSLALDPFDQKQPWSARPLWQTAWLCVILVIEFGVLVIDIFFKK